MHTQTYTYTHVLIHHTHTHTKAGLHVSRSEKDMYVINNVKENMLFGYPNKKAIVIVMCNTIVEWPHLQRV